MDISAKIYCIKYYPLRDAAFGADCLTPLRILKIITVRLKMDSGDAISQILICDPLCIYCPNFVVISLMVQEKNRFENCHSKYSVSTLRRCNIVSLATKIDVYA